MSDSQKPGTFLGLLLQHGPIEFGRFLNGVGQPRIIMLAVSTTGLRVTVDLVKMGGKDTME
jgi:hypothetical protein